MAKNDTMAALFTGTLVILIGLIVFCRYNQRDKEGLDTPSVSYPYTYRYNKLVSPYYRYDFDKCANDPDKQLDEGGDSSPYYYRYGKVYTPYLASSGPYFHHQSFSPQNVFGVYYVDQGEYLGHFPR